MSESTYNLRSNKADQIQVPIQLQLNNDSDFLSQLLKTNTQPHNEESDSSSESDLNCSDVVGTSDGEQAGGQECERSDDVSESAPDNSAVQQLINSQILSQLQTISQRLDKIEQTHCKKTNDPKKVKTSKNKHPSNDKSKSISAKQGETSATPNSTQHQILPQGVDQIPQLHTIRQDLLIQAQVEKRLKELAEAEKSGTHKQKSLRGGPVEVLVPNKVKWPHEYVLSGSQKERVSYDQLSVIQWVTGFCRIMRDEQNRDIQNSMLDYLIALFDDANDFSWEAAKASHAVLLCRMEQGEIKDYAQVEKIDRVRRANAQRHVSPVSTSSQHIGAKKQTTKATKSMLCQYYNQGSCAHLKSHDTRGTLYKHICTHCFATSGKTFTHPESQCRNKQKKQTKNE